MQGECISMEGGSFEPFANLLAKVPITNEDYKNRPVEERERAIDLALMGLTGEPQKVWDRRLQELRQQKGPLEFREVFPGQPALRYLQGALSNPDIGYFPDAATQNALRQL